MIDQRQGAGTAAASAANRTLALLSLVAMISFIDRQVVSVLVEPIKGELGISDTQIGLLTGVAFATFYVLGGIPLARLGDRGNRRNLIATCTAVWSVATVACGLVHSFVHLILARIGVAAAEAGAAPAIQSILADIFPFSKRGGAVGILMAAQSLGVAAGLVLGGWLNQLFGWRAAFVLVGLPGLLIASAIRLWVREPRRGQLDADRPATLPGGNGLRLLLRKRSYTLILVGLMLHNLTGYAVFGWFPAFLIRVHHLSTAQVGVLMGAPTAGGLLIGSFTAGFLADRLAPHDARWYMRITAFGCFLLGPLMILTLLMPGVAGTIAVFSIYSIAGGLIFPPIYVAVHGLTRADMRAVGTFLVVVVTNIGGVGFGPFLVGMLNDQLAPRYGGEAVRYSLMIAALAAPLAGFAYLLANRWIPAEFAGVQSTRYATADKAAATVSG